MVKLISNYNYSFPLFMDYGNVSGTKDKVNNKKQKTKKQILK